MRARPAAPERARSTCRRSATTVSGLLVLADWLEAHGVTQVAMEATGVYWKPVWAVLEDRFDCLLVNARHVKQVPGPQDRRHRRGVAVPAAEAGLLRASLVPPTADPGAAQPHPLSQGQIRDRQREAGRLHKLLEDTGIKLDCVASDLLGKSGRAMLAALIAGTTDPDVLAELAHGPAARQTPGAARGAPGALRRPARGDHRRILAHLDYLDERSPSSRTRSRHSSRPRQPAVDLLRTIPGIQRRTAEVILAETGGDMCAFPTANHLASWAGSARATTNPPASAAPAAPARAPNGSAPT